MMTQLDSKNPVSAKAVTIINRAPDWDSGRTCKRKA